MFRSRRLSSILALSSGPVRVQISFPPRVAALMLQLLQEHHQVSRILTATLVLTVLLLSVTSKHGECITAESTAKLPKSLKLSTPFRQGDCTAYLTQ